VHGGWGGGNWETENYSFSSRAVGTKWRLLHTRPAWGGQIRTKEVGGLNIPASHRKEKKGRVPVPGKGVKNNTYNKKGHPNWPRKGKREEKAKKNDQFLDEKEKVRTASGGGFKVVMSVRGKRKEVTDHLGRKGGGEMPGLCDPRGKNRRSLRRLESKGEDKSPSSAEVVGAENEGQVGVDPQLSALEIRGGFIT